MTLLPGKIRWISDNRELILLLLISIAIKLTLVVYAPAINADGVRYICAAQEIWQGNLQKSLTIEKMPLYPFLIGAFQLALRDWALAGRMISFFSLVLALIPVYLITRQLFDARVAFWSGAAFVLCPRLNEHAAELIRDPLFLLFFLWSVYLLLRSLQTGEPRFFFFLSVTIPMTILSRIEGILLPVFFLAVVTLQSIVRKDDFRAMLKGVAVFAAIPLILGAAAVLLLGSESLAFNRFEEVGEGMRQILDLRFFDSYRNIYAKLKELEYGIPGWEGHFSFAENARHYLFLLYLIGALEALARNLWLYSIPLLFGLTAIRQSARNHKIVLSLAVIYFLVGYLRLVQLNFISKRYLLVTAVLSLPWVGKGIVLILEEIYRRKIRKVAAGVFLLLILLAPVYKIFAHMGGETEAARAAGEWLGNTGQVGNAGIISNDDRIPFYAGMNWGWMKFPSVSDDYLEMERLAFQNEKQYLIIEIAISRKHIVPEMHNYALEKEFFDKKNVVMVFRNKDDRL